MEKVIKLLAKYYPVYLSGLWGTLWISAVTVLSGALLGMLVALMRMSRSKLLNGIAGAYVEILRGTPILLQLYFFWIGLPKLVPFELSDTQCIVAALAVNASAFISEIIRAGIAAVDKGQWEAARSIGLSESHMMTHVILPQAVKNILPALYHVSCRTACQNHKMNHIQKGNHYSTSIANLGDLSCQNREFYLQW